MTFHDLVTRWYPRAVEVFKNTNEAQAQAAALMMARMLNGG